LRMLLPLLWHVLPLLRGSLPVRPERLSHDTQVAENYVADPLIPKSIAIRLLREMRRGCDACMHEATLVRVPSLLVHGTEDRIAPPRGSEHLLQRLGAADKELRLVAGARHEVHQELPQWRDPMLAKLTSWIGERACRPSAD
jgi:acylglycerol lipase